MELDSGALFFSPYIIFNWIFCYRTGTAFRRKKATCNWRGCHNPVLVSRLSLGEELRVWLAEKIKQIWENQFHPKVAGGKHNNLPWQSSTRLSSWTSWKYCVKSNPPRNPLVVSECQQDAPGSAVESQKCLFQGGQLSSHLENAIVCPVHKKHFLMQITLASYHLSSNIPLLIKI